MKSKSFIFFLLAISLFSRSLSQNPFTDYQNCLSKINEAEAKEADGITDKYFEDNPNPQKYVWLACDDHFPKYQCRQHKKQCFSACTCGKNFKNELNVVTEKYKVKRDACEKAYQDALAKQNSKNNNSANKKSTDVRPEENAVVYNKVSEEKTEYKNQSNQYLKNAQDTSRTGIYRQTNLNNAKTSALMSGDQEQIERINKIQAKENETRNQQMISNTITLAKSLSELFKKRYPVQETGPTLETYYSFSDHQPQVENFTYSSLEEAKNELLNIFRKNPLTLKYSFHIVDSININDSMMIIYTSTTKYITSKPDVYRDIYHVNMLKSRVFDVRRDFNSGGHTYAKEIRKDDYTGVYTKVFSITSKKSKLTERYMYDEDEPFSILQYIKDSPDRESIVEKCADLFYFIIVNYRLSQ